MVSDPGDRMKIVIGYALWATVCAAVAGGAVALVGGSILARLGRALHATLLLGLLVGVFDFVINFLQMAVPRTELGWVPDLVMLAAAVVVITVLGSRPVARTPL